MIEVVPVPLPSFHWVRGWTRVAVWLCTAGCAVRSAPAAEVPGEPVTPAAPQQPSADPARILQEAEAALLGEEAARAATLFGRYLAARPDDPPRARQAYLGLARSHELLGDCAAAVRAYDALLDRDPDPRQRVVVLARRGACEAEIERYEASAASFGAIRDTPDQLPSVYVEALARRGYALFELGRLDEAEAVLAEADAVFERAQADDEERFASHYFVGMARFYRAAILHRRFREVEIELPEKVMEAAFAKKLELLSAAQGAYNHAIRANHMFWVSAAGYQLGHLFGELYDDLMYAPVPAWLDERARRIYYDELKKQLRPVFEKAVWVFEKNLEAARKFGYESPFVERTQAQLGHMQAVLLSGEPDLGRPHPRLVSSPEGDRGGEPPIGEAPSAEADLPVEDRKLFVPAPTPL